MQPMMPYQRRVVLILLGIISIGLMLKIIDRQRRAVGFDVNGFLDGYKYSSDVKSAGKGVKLATNVNLVSVADSSVEPAPAENKIIDINVADVLELQALPGIGPVLAQRIVDYRDSIGHFNTPDDLLEVKGIGEKKLVKIKEHLKIEKIDN